MTGAARGIGKAIAAPLRRLKQELSISRCHPTKDTYSIVEGEATLIFERSRQNLKKGDCVYLPP